MEDIEKYIFLKKLKALPFIDAIYLYGSRARGDNNKRSDIDLAIKVSGSESNSWHEILDIIEDADTLLKIDCVNLDTIDDKFRERILSEGRKL